MPKKIFNDNVAFVTIDLIKEDRFSFVEDELLQENLAINAQYIAFLSSLEKTYKTFGAVKYSIFLTIIIYAAGIAEALLSYSLKKLVKEEKYKKSDIFKGKKEVKKIGNICVNEKAENIVFGIEREVQKKWDEQKFNNLISAAKKSKFFDKDLLKECDDLRDKRNKIHISGLTNSGDTFFEEDDIKSIFEFLGKFISAVSKI